MEDGECGVQHPTDPTLHCTRTVENHRDHSAYISPSKSVGWPNTEWIKPAILKHSSAGESLPQLRRRVKIEEPAVKLGANSPATSVAAAETVLPHTGTQRWTILTMLLEHPKGLTDSQLVRLTEIQPNSERPRRGELVDMALVGDSGDCGVNLDGNEEIIWVATPLAQQLSAVL